MPRILLTVLLLLAFAGTAAADDKNPKPEQITYRITGLFAPDREKDLRAAFEELPDFKLIAVSFADAEITVEFSPQKLAPGQKPERVTEIVGEKLRSVSHGTFSVKPRNTVPRDKLKDVVIPAKGLDCKACCLAAYEAVANVDGVVHATASFKEGRVTVRFDPAKTDVTKLEEALKKKGVDLGKK